MKTIEPAMWEVFDPLLDQALKREWETTFKGKHTKPRAFFRKYRYCFFLFAGERVTDTVADCNADYDSIPNEVSQLRSSCKAGETVLSAIGFNVGFKEFQNTLYDKIESVCAAKGFSTASMREVKDFDSNKFHKT